VLSGDILVEQNTRHRYRTGCLRAIRQGLGTGGRKGAPTGQASSHFSVVFTTPGRAVGFSSTQFAREASTPERFFGPRGNSTSPYSGRWPSRAGAVDLGRGGSRGREFSVTASSGTSIGRPGEAQGVHREHHSGNFHNQAALARIGAERMLAAGAYTGREVTWDEMLRAKRAGPGIDLDNYHDAPTFSHFCALRWPESLESSEWSKPFRRTGSSESLLRGSNELASFLIRRPATSSSTPIRGTVP